MGMCQNYEGAGRITREANEMVQLPD